jgi:hypothetical protein
MGTVLWISALILMVIYGPLYLMKAAGYLIQKFKFGVPFKELYKYHKEQDRLEAKDD